MILQETLIPQLGNWRLCLNKRKTVEVPPGKPPHSNKQWEGSISPGQSELSLLFPNITMGQFLVTIDLISLSFPQETPVLLYKITYISWKNTTDPTSYIDHAHGFVSRPCTIDLLVCFSADHSIMDPTKN